MFIGPQNLYQKFATDKASIVMKTIPCDVIKKEKKLAKEVKIIKHLKIFFCPLKTNLSVQKLYITILVTYFPF